MAAYPLFYVRMYLCNCNDIAHRLIRSMYVQFDKLQSVIVFFILIPTVVGL